MPSSRTIYMELRGVSFLVPYDRVEHLFGSGLVDGAFGLDLSLIHI